MRCEVSKPNVFAVLAAVSPKSLARLARKI
jgi:hypothetical protein